MAGPGRRFGSVNIKSEKPFAVALRMELAASGDSHRELRLIARNLIGLARAGDPGALQAIREIADRLDGKPKQEAEVTLRNALASELSDDGLAAIAAGAKDDGVESSSEPKPDLKLKREARLSAMPAIIAIFARRRPKMISMIAYLRVSTTQQGKSGLGLEPHLNLLALTPRLLEAVGASVRPGNVPGVLMDVVRDPLAFDH